MADLKTYKIVLNKPYSGHEVTVRAEKVIIDLALVVEFRTGEELVAFFAREAVVSVRVVEESENG